MCQIFFANLYLSTLPLTAVVCFRFSLSNIAFPFLVNVLLFYFLNIYIFISCRMCNFLVHMFSQFVLYEKILESNLVAPGLRQAANHSNKQAKGLLSLEMFLLYSTRPGFVPDSVIIKFNNKHTLADDQNRGYLSLHKVITFERLEMMPKS